MTDSPRALAVAVRPVALAWIAAAEDALRSYIGKKATFGRPDGLVVAALATNFSLPSSRIPLRGAVTAARIAAMFARARIVIEDDTLLFDIADEEATRLFPEGTPLPPAYALFDRGVYFTSAFARFGSMCRAAMLVHESIHVIDAASGAPEAHVSEWDEPRFSAQSLEDSLHNPSAYASFAAQVHEGALTWPVAVRYGAGRPDT